MLFFLRELSSIWGPFRLTGSHLILICVGTFLGGGLVWYFLPKLWDILPLDRGKSHAPGGEASKGTPTGAGLWIAALLLPVLLFALPWRIAFSPQWGVVGCLALAMWTGYADDRSKVEWSGLKKGIFDFLIAILTVGVLLSNPNITQMWLPFFKGTFTVPLWLYFPCAVALLFLAINATNCSDGVDGLAGTLTMMSLFALTIFLYAVIGYEPLSRYFLVPHKEDGALWAILMATVAGGVAGYLWHNASPSRVFMGDAGSRPLGLLVGVAVLVSGNPFLLLVVSPIVLINGGTGLVKVAVLKFMRRLGMDITKPQNGNEHNAHPVVRTLHRVQFPFHDHCRKNLQWSKAQILMRFMLLQGLLMPILFLILLKVR